MKWFIYFFFFLLSGCAPAISNQQVSYAILDTRNTADAECPDYIYEKRDTLEVQTPYGKESHVLLGEIEVDSICFDLFTVCRKVEIADGFRQSCFLLFRNETDQIWYNVWNNDISCFLDVYQNKIVVRKENGVYCFEDFEGFADEIVFECIDGLLQR